ncbi:hypothetical protein DMC30DRAFT_394475 [Rhodotorula diobovata]|uniref:Uncharacterized protein n=1 Tax=Rhodotorula diobovata TaxID=5288 RepID=A0A5C5FZV0_9BASI|nr:hypothetical protein DMC30DRAFT_394475 [Rhodotorula diobovata]
MDSYEIVQWLDEAYPDRPCLFLPEAALPVDVSSDKYAAALERYKGVYVWESLKSPSCTDPFDRAAPQRSSRRAAKGSTRWRGEDITSPDDDSCRRHSQLERRSLDNALWPFAEDAGPTRPRRERRTAHRVRMSTWASSSSSFVAAHWPCTCQ